MRILFCPTHYILDSDREGSEYVWAYNIVDRIASTFPGSAVVVGRSELTEPKAYPVVEVMPDNRGLVPGNFHALEFNLRYTAKTLRALRDASFDLVHHVLPFAVHRTFNVAAALPRRNTPFVIGPVQPPLTMSDFYAEHRDGPPTPSRRWSRRLAGGAAAIALRGVGVLSTQTLQRSERVVVVDSAARDLVLSHGVGGERIVIIPPGVDCDRFTIDEAADEATPLRLLVACRLVKRKNVSLVLRAFAEARREGVSASLSVVGTGPELQRLRESARRLGIEQEVAFAGFVPHAQIPQQYREADVFVNASVSEGFSTTCLEAMASGLPPVSTRVGGFSEAVRDGYNGYLVAQGDQQAMTERIVALSRDRALLRVFSQRARSTVLQRFDWQRVVIPAYVDLYRRVLEEGRRARRAGDRGRLG